MNSRLTLLSLWLSLISVALGQAKPAASGEYKPSGGFYSMQLHFRWCGEAETATERVKRYEKFWELQAPETSDGYDDTLHVHTVRRCAYRLAQLYTELGRKKDGLRMLKWLEAEDDTLKTN